eukprot:scaffold22668_cov161-Cylindrotheca_fusiformis.AAC.6
MDQRVATPSGSQNKPLSPASPFESLFLAGLTPSHISADTLAQELRRNRSANTTSSLQSANTVATDDFLSAVGNPDDLDSTLDDDQSFSKPRTQSIPELDADTSDEEQEQETMSTKVSSSSIPTPMGAKKSPPGSSSEEPHPDAAANVYEGAKGVWAWGKGVPVFSPFMGIAEAVAGKALGVAGTNLEEVDGTIKPHLKNLDNGVLNPAIHKVVDIMMGAAGKTEEMIKPIIVILLTPFKMLEQERNEAPEVTK